MATPPGFTLLVPLWDFPLEQSRDGSLKHTFDQVKVIDACKPSGHPKSAFAAPPINRGPLQKNWHGPRRTIGSKCTLTYWTEGWGRFVPGGVGGGLPNEN
ncbi:hypothetical protein MHYP_G00227070 [Metynnis hypsauchen]